MDAAGDIYLDTYAGWYSVRDERFFTEARDVRRRRRHPDRHRDRRAGDLDRGADLLLPAVGLRGQAAGALRGASRVHRARRTAQRGGQLRLRRAARPVDLAHDVRLGRAGARPSRPRHVRVGRRADQLPDRRRLSGHRLGAVPTVLARRSAHDRQGHHPVPHRVLAGVPDVGGNRVAAQGVRARVRAQPRREDEQVGRQRRRPGGTWSTRSASTRCATSCCGRCRSGRTAATAKRRSSVASTPTWPTSWATWRSARCRWSPRTWTESSRSQANSPPTTRDLLKAARRLAGAGARPFRRHRHASGAGGDLVGARRGQQVLLRTGAVGAAQDRCTSQRFRTVLYTTLEVVRIAALLSQPVMPESTRQAARPARPAGGPADFRGDRHPARAGHGAARPGRGVPRAIRWSDLSCASRRKVHHFVGVSEHFASARHDEWSDARHVLSRMGDRRCLEGMTDTQSAKPHAHSRRHRRRLRRNLAANHLRMRADVDITLVNPRPKFVERIRLHQLVAGNCDATVDYGTLLGEGIRLVVDTATRIDTANRTVELASGRALDYDYVIYAVGSTGTVPAAVPGAAEFAYPIAELEHAQTAARRARRAAPRRAGHRRRRRTDRDRDGHRAGRAGSQGHAGLRR